MGSCVQLYGTHWLKPRNPPPPAFGLIDEGAIGQPRKTTFLCNPLLKTLVDFSNLVTRPCVKKYESYVSGAAAALKLILKNFGTVIRTNIDSPSTSVGVDISKVRYYTKAIWQVWSYFDIKVPALTGTL